MTGSGLALTGGGLTVVSASGGGGGSGTVTSVDVTGATSGLTSSGGPVTTSGTITLGVTTQAAGDNTTNFASTAFVTTAIANAVAGVNPAVAVKAATTAASDTSGLTYNNGVAGIGAFFTGTINTALTVDGVTFTAIGQRLLVKNDTQSPSGAFNGVYYVTQVQTIGLPPILTRALDYNSPNDINNTGAIPVVSGTANASTSWLLTSSVTTVGTDALTYTQFSIAPTSVVTLTGTQTLTNKTYVYASDTWANRPGSPATGQLYYASDVGTSGALLRYNGTRWKPINGTCLLATLDAVSSNITNSADTIVFQYQIPAAFLQLADRLRFRFSSSKSGTTDVGNLNIRVGTAGTTADQSIFGGAHIGAANVAGAVAMDVRVASATSLLVVNNSGVSTPTVGYSQQSTGAVVAAVTISNISNSLFVSISMQSAGATNTVNLRDAQLEYVASAN